MRASNADSVVDGNALAGLLADFFGSDVTTIVGTCGGCGAIAPLAETKVELDDDAAIVRCRSCTHTLLTVLRDAGGVRLRFGSIGELAQP